MKSLCLTLTCLHVNLASFQREFNDLLKDFRSLVWISELIDYVKKRSNILEEKSNTFIGSWLSLTFFCSLCQGMITRVFAMFSPVNSAFMHANTESYMWTIRKCYIWLLHVYFFSHIHLQTLTESLFRYSVYLLLIPSTQHTQMVLDVNDSENKEKQVK